MHAYKLNLLSTKHSKKKRKREEVPILKSLKAEENTSYRGLHVHATLPGDRAASLHNLDYDICSPGQLRRARIERDPNGIENIELPKPRISNPGSLEQPLQRGGALHVLQLGLDEPLLGLGVTVDQHVMHSEMDRLSLHLTEEVVNLQLVRA